MNNETIAASKLIADFDKKLEKARIAQLFNKDFLLTWDKSEDELLAVMTVAEILRLLHREKKPFRIFDSGLAISIFRDNSTRTRFSFASAVNALGLGLAELDEVKSQVSHGETVRETANMISFLTEVIGIRDDMYLGEGHTYMKEVADAVDEGFREEILAQRPAVINLQSDLDHPTQSLSDLMKIADYFGGFDNLAGKKIAMTWAYSPSYGKPLSVPQGIINLMPRFGMDVVLAHPEGYDLVPELVESASDFASTANGSFRISHDMKEAFENADIVYPKSWAPWEIMQQRTKLLKLKDQPGLDELEKHCLNNNARYVSWECNEELMKLTKNGNALYQHCLPADISGVNCTHGEVSASLFEKYRLHTYQEAGYKPFVIAAMIFLAKVKDPGKRIKEFLDA